MTYLVDTNVLLRIVQPSHPMSSAASASMNSLLEQGERLFILPQNVIEFWAVATRPESANGLGLTVAETEQKISIFRRTLSLLPDAYDVFEQWQKLAVKHQVAGKQVYDARLVAAMIVHDVSHLLTFNTEDFKRYDEITLVNPQNIPEK